MFNTYATPAAARAALRFSGLDILDMELRPTFDGVQPVLICHSIRDAEEVQNRGFSARLDVEYATD